MASPDHDVSRRGGDVGPHRHLEDQTDHLLFFCHLSSRVAKHYSHASWSLRSPCGICCFAPNILFVAARTVWHELELSRGGRDRLGNHIKFRRCHLPTLYAAALQRSLTGHLNRGIDGVFEIVRVVGRGLVSIAEVHAIIARAHLAQSEPEMARDRFGLLKRHGFVKSSSGSVSNAVDELHAMLGARPGRGSCSRTTSYRQGSLAVEAAGQFVALDLRERHHTCLASRISMASTYSSLRQRLALRSASARLHTHSARLKAVTPLGQNLLGGCAAKWITTQWL